MNKILGAALAAAGLSAAFCTGCGDRTDTRTAETTRAATSVTTAPVTTTFTDSTVWTTTYDTALFSTTTYETVTTSRGILDSAEDALDSAGDAVTGILTKLTSEIHNHSTSTTAAR